MSQVGIVLIGRNEGDRLIRSLDAVVGSSRPVVYVDSGSTDGSCQAALDRAVDVVTLDLSIPFTAARARNAGFDRLQQQHPDLDYVQFIDGDCEVTAGWLDAAAEALDEHPNVVAVCGWRRERYPDRSVYNRICDVEWRLGSAGLVESFGGDVMIRADAFSKVEGYNSSMIAGEDPELSVRLRRIGDILRLDRTSTVHDADMHHLSQWWNRIQRGGFAYALVASMYANQPERKFVSEARRIWIWGILAPVSAIALAPITHGISLAAFLRYPLASLKTFRRTTQQGFSIAECVAWSLSCGVSVFPEAIGALRFYLLQLRGQQAELIEYKS
ncbi:glycosyltransferase [Microcoleus sp. FACHB-1515]|uniref:glycosyltransferase n=1 Tax=Cyanophyceae TaxID=3028117 RepID=UPI001686BA8A|nr:glycosyltransferase [Microcoleus sp. FACHB-1515]MBD2089496.1 glycosyltransferase [Microcoleus sp. FACHB-1515]